MKVPHAPAGVVKGAPNLTLLRPGSGQSPTRYADRSRREPAFFCEYEKQGLVLQQKIEDPAEKSLVSGQLAQFGRVKAG